MRSILEHIDMALRLKGLKDAGASKLAVGNPSLIKNIRAGQGNVGVESLRRLAEVLDLELYFGPRREVGPIEQVTLDGADFAAIPLLDVQLSAGHGAENGDSQALEMLAFPRPWLQQLGVLPSQARLVSVTGDSMLPTLRDGDIVMIDQGRTTVQHGAIYALTDLDGSTRVKHIDLVPKQGLILRSANPTYPAEPRLTDKANGIKIIGQVVWSGSVLR